MTIFKFKKRVEIEKSIGNLKLETFHYGSYEVENTKIGQNYTYGMTTIVNIALVVGNVEAMRENAKIVVA